MSGEEFAKKYNENIRKEQVQIKCDKCGFEVWVFPEDYTEKRAVCHCGNRSWELIDGNGIL
jgi:Zn finger protein HypA/HybF involved in hydrogenase expression